MRICNLQIERWRNLRDLTIQLDASADFICLVGENGAGKSNLLELIAYAAPHFGLTSELTPKRRFPHQRRQPFKVAATLDLEGMVSTDGFVAAGLPASAVEQWNGTLTFTAHGDAMGANQPAPTPQIPLTFNSQDGAFYMQGTMLAGGIAEVSAAFQLAQRVRDELHLREQVLHLYIDAERVFPDVTVTDAEVLERARQDLREPAVIRQQAAIATQNLYLEWMRSLLGEQQRMQGEFWEESNKAARDGEPPPLPQDSLASYRAALREVLPHLEFVHLDPAERRLIYDSAGAELPYEDLSGGERELAFLVGQMERFGVRDGLFLLDEPELHLNAELLQRWLAYLRSSTASGQVWIATHALEAVEAAGQASTLVMERDADRTVRRARPLGERPALATLAPLLGTPAFSLTDTTFVLVEGERPGRERERFVQVTGAGPRVRFVEAGGCEELARRFGGLEIVASEAEQLRVGAFIDRDHRSDEQVEQFEEEHHVGVLPVHEIENFFLHPDLLDALIDQGGLNLEVETLLRTATDPLAGRWIWQRAVTRAEWGDPPGISIERARSLDWAKFGADRSAATSSLLEPFAADADGQTASQRRAALARAVSEYAEVRDNRDRLWREVEGKEALQAIATTLGFSDPEALESRAARLWRDGELPRAAEAAALLTEIEDFALQG